MPNNSVGEAEVEPIDCVLEIQSLQGGGGVLYPESAAYQIKQELRDIAKQLKQKEDQEESDLA